MKALFVDLPAQVAMHIVPSSHEVRRGSRQISDQCPHATQENQGLDFQAFFDLLQRLAEERGLMGAHNGYSKEVSCKTSLE